MAEYVYNPLVTDQTVGTPIAPLPESDLISKMAHCKCSQSEGESCTCAPAKCGCLGCPKNGSTKLKLTELPKIDYFNTKDESQLDRQVPSTTENHGAMDGSVDGTEKCCCIVKDCGCVEDCECEGRVSRTGSLRLKAKNQLEKVQSQLDKVQKAIGVKKLTDEEKMAKAVKKADKAEKDTME